MARKTQFETYDPKTGILTVGGEPTSSDSAITDPNRGIINKDSVNMPSRDLGVTNAPITGELLDPVESADFETFEEPALQDVSNLNSDVSNTGQIGLTQPEQEAQGLSERIRGLTESLGGESAFKAEQQEKFGVSEKMTLEEDLSNQLLTLKEQQFILPLEEQAAIAGKGVTKSGLRTRTFEKERNRAIAAFTTSSLLRAAQGQVVSARRNVADAVAAEFDPIKEQIAIAEKNLQRIIDSPAYSVAEKNRASAQLEIQQAKKVKIAEAEQTKTAIKNTAVDVAQNVNDATILDMIGNAKTEIEAIQIAGELLNSPGWEYVNTPALRDSLIAQGFEIIQAGGRTYAKPGEPGKAQKISSDNGITPTGKPMSTNQIEQFRRSYGWTPPFGYSQAQLLEYMQANPDATPEELEAGAKQASGETTEETPGLELTEEYFRTNFSEERLKELADKFNASKWYTGKKKDINRFLIEIMKQIETARSQGISDEETLAFINE